MSKRLLTTILLLLIVNILPVSYYLIRQSASLSDNENMVQMVFEKQVESILFSLNQETENTINQWVNNLDLPIDYSGNLMEDITKRLFANNQALKQIEFQSLSNRSFHSVYSRNESELATPKLPDVDLHALKNYLKDGYQRIDSKRNGNDIILTFFLKSDNSNLYCTILVNIQLMVEQNLRPKIQQTAQNIFAIEVNDSISQHRLFTTDPDIEGHYQNHTSSWYIPGIWFGLQLKTQTIEQLIVERNKTENRMLIALLLLSVTGTLVIIFSIRKTISINNMKAEFISNVSHELRTPLALISMYSETLLLNRVKTEEKRKKYIQVINQETNRLSDLVNRILNFSKIEKKKVTYAIVNIDLNALIEQTISNYEPHFIATNVACTFNPSEEKLTIEADHEALTETLINMIDNAIKYGKEDDKKIDIRSKKVSGKVVIEVQDNGIGISKRNQKRIFDKFYRVTLGNLAQQAKGAGLGLNIVKNNMKAFNGKVIVTSELGLGSCFILIFPQSTHKQV
jgi:two-component system, OmpR family, phosphate regulon sensor histidine kinase PhoR